MERKTEKETDRQTERRSRRRRRRGRRKDILVYFPFPTRTLVLLKMTIRLTSFNLHCFLKGSFQNTVTQSL